MLVLCACGGDDGREWTCMVPAGTTPEFSPEIGCEADFLALASEPLSASIPGARASKTVLDRADGDALYFQNSETYPIHWEFARAHLSGDGKPIVPELGQFNLTEYYSPDRRFLLGSLTHYEGPDVWVYEISPYDTASADMITTAFRAIAGSLYVGDVLKFHPTSAAVETVAADLPADVPVITTDELFEGIEYQPLNLGTTMGQLAFYLGSEVETAYPWFREITVLDAVPNDIAVTAGIITGEFQTPLSHINVLSQNRGTPNMGLRGAYDDPELRALEGKWVELTVGAFEWSIREVTQAEADAWWEDHKPEPIDIGPPDLGITDLRDSTAILDLATYSKGDAIRAVVPAFGGKAAHYGGLALLGPEVNAPEAFVVPIYYYDQHMTQNGLWDMATTMMADPAFQSDPATRAAQLQALQDAIMAAPLDPAFESMITDKITTRWPELPRTRFRSSTNAEDLGDFTGAGLYTSKTGDVDDPLDPIQNAIREVWSSVWYFRAYEERSYHSIDHMSVGMALLVAPSFPDEEANGVALTGNIFDTSGLEPGFYVNAQIGELSVVQPDPGVTTDQYIHYFTQPGMPIVFLGHSNQVPQGTNVLTNLQMYDLAVGMNVVHEYFREVYGTTPGKFYAMDIEFKFDGDVGAEPVLYIKQARPHPGWGL